MTRTLFISASSLALLATTSLSLTPAHALTSLDNPSILATSPSPAAPTADQGWWSGQPKADKLLYTNLAAAALIGIWGFIEWDYGSGGWNEAHFG